MYLSTLCYRVSLIFRLTRRERNLRHFGIAARNGKTRVALQDPIAHPALLPECNQPKIQLQIQLWNTVANTIVKYSCKYICKIQLQIHLRKKQKYDIPPSCTANHGWGKENTFIKKYREALRTGRLTYHRRRVGIELAKKDNLNPHGHNCV